MATPSFQKFVSSNHYSNTVVSLRQIAFPTQRLIPAKSSSIPTRTAARLCPSATSHTKNTITKVYGNSAIMTGFRTILASIS